MNVLIIGNGHYATGSTVISDKRETDKDSGVLLPSVLELQSRGVVKQIGIASRNGQKLNKIKDRLAYWNQQLGWTTNVLLFPETKSINDYAYVEALKKMPKPCVALIAVPDFLHKEVVLECIRQKVSFLVVKPAVINLHDLYLIIDKMKEKNVFGMVDYHKVFDEANILLKNEFGSGVYGKINHVYSLMTQRRDMIDIYKRWLEVDNTMNINHYLGSHYIHLTGFLTKAEPLDVRSTCQYGYAAEKTKKNIADLIQTHIRWKSEENHIFSSYHVAGWNDPVETESMTYQQYHLLCEHGHVDSDQRYRGFKKVLSQKGVEISNPYFFNLTLDWRGAVNLDTKYGFISIKTFIEAATMIENKQKTPDDFNAFLPTITESQKVTAILEASDISLANDNNIVRIEKQKGRYSVINQCHKNSK